MIWLFKLTMTPLLVLAATLVIRRWGATAGGLVAGIPLMTGPIMLFLAIELGEAFAVATITAVLIAVVGGAMFSTTYALLAQFWRWPGTLAAALAAWLLTAFGLSAFPLDMVAAAIAAWLSILVAVLLIPRPRGAIVIARSSQWDLPFRMAVTGALVAVVTSLAADLGPHLSGIFGMLPLISTVLASFTHHQSGPRAVKAMLRSQMVSMVGFVVFFVVVAMFLETLGIAVTFTLALAATLLASALTAMLDRGIADLAGPPRSRRR